MYIISKKNENVWVIYFASSIYSYLPADFIPHDSSAKICWIHFFLQ